MDCNTSVMIQFRLVNKSKTISLSSPDDVLHVEMRLSNKGAHRIFFNCLKHLFYFLLESRWVNQLSFLTVRFLSLITFLFCVGRKCVRYQTCSADISLHNHVFIFPKYCSGTDLHLFYSTHLTDL